MRNKTLAGALGACVLLGAVFTVPLSRAGAASCEGASRADFNGDGHDDFAVGDPKASLGDAVSAGQVTVLYGEGRPGKGEPAVLRDGTPQSGAGFGYSIATADLNGDRCLDLVVGSPWADEGTGRAQIFLGSPQGLKPGAVLKPGRATRTFGWSVTAAGRDGGSPTVVVGAPYETVGGKESAGAVHVFTVGGDGGAALRSVVDQDSPRAEGVAEAGDLFGWAVKLGRIRGKADWDLIVSEPGEDVENQAVDAGSFTVVEDVATDGQAKGEHWHYGNLGVGAPSPGGNIGWSLAYAEENGTAYVAVGIPGQTVDGKERAGIVALLTSVNGQGLKPLRTIPQTLGGKSFVEAGDRYGWSLALADGAVTGSGVQLAVGVPHDGAGDARPENGWVHLVPLSAPDDALLIDALNGNVPGDAGAYDHFGWSVAFTTGALLIGVPDDREEPCGTLIVRPLDKRDPVQIRPDSEADETDFGAALAG